jgi:peptidoglycan pentaglycine glycine transferase (the first glycine)
MSTPVSEVGTTPSTLSIVVSEELEDRRWDTFLADVGGHHTQTSAWGRVKHGAGWRPLRITIEDGHGAILAGAQLLHRRAPLVGEVAYLSRGPVSNGEPFLRDRVLGAIRDVSRSARLRAVLIEPPADGGATTTAGSARDLTVAHQRLSLGATVRVDVARPPTEILAGMRSKTRYNVRRGLKRAITVRRGDAGDLKAFHHLLELTGRRQGFQPAGLGSYQRWSDVLGGDGQFQLFLAELQGRPVSAMIAIPFGGTVVYKRGAWSGEHGDLRPNEALHWNAITWAHEAGHRWYDLDGIDRVPAELVTAGQPVPDRYLSSVTRFKLGFGGEVVLLPESLLMVRGSLIRQGYRRLGPRLATAPRLGRLITSRM